MKRALALALLGCAACSPDLPDRACSRQADCFTQEVCVQKQCVTARPATDDATAEDAGLPDVAVPESTDGGADAVP
ncbi:MAG: hypothetical protein R3F60_26855 [bacterium]